MHRLVHFKQIAKATCPRYLQVLTETLSQHDSSQHGSAHFSPAVQSVARPRGSPLLLNHSHPSADQVDADKLIDKPLAIVSFYRLCELM